MSYTFAKVGNDKYDLIIDGEYEVTLENIIEATTMSGKKKLDITFRIRQDVEQAHQNRVVFEAIWQEKETSFYNRKRLNQLLGTQEVKDGTVFNNIQDIIATLKGAKLVAKVITAFDDYRKQDVNKIAFYKSTQIKNKTLGDTKQTTSKPKINDEDLPF
jgi:hypothetical protein